MDTPIKQLALLKQASFENVPGASVLQLDLAKNRWR